jgi:stage II sporulation protein D
LNSRRDFFALLGAFLNRAGLAANPQSAAGRAKNLFEGAPAPDDPLELLYSRRLSFERGQPLITVRVVEGRQQAMVQPLSRCAIFVRTASGEQRRIREVPRQRLAVKLLEGTPGVGATWVELEQLRFDDKAGVQRAREAWGEKGVQIRVATVGQAYGIAGHVVDTRRYAILADGDATEASARAQAEQIEKKFGIRTQLHRELSHRPHGRIALTDAHGGELAVGDSALELRADKGIAVEQVEFGMGYSFHGFEQRTYPGRLFATVDAQGTLALVAALPMERLVKGVVPSEIFAKAHIEALKAQAVTARGEVLAKIGARHLGDPYLLCAEQHCQVYKGTAAEERVPDAAVDATRGQALFAANGALVDSVYSAVCGGFTEDNDAVWGGPADPNLRGRPDFPPQARGMAPFWNGVGAALVGRFVQMNPVQTYCSMSGLAKPDKVRWRRSFTQSEMDEACAALGVGSVQALAVEGRGVSGRARALRIHGEKSVARVYGELAIRRLFHNLNSGMFVVEKEGQLWTFVGGGWGHGSGMCQTGAIGRAEKGATYRGILGWYYSGAKSQRIY